MGHWSAKPGTWPLKCCLSVAPAAAPSPLPGLYLWTEFSGSSSLPSTLCSSFSPCSFQSLCLSLTHSSPHSYPVSASSYSALFSFPPPFFPSPSLPLPLPLASLFPLFLLSLFALLPSSLSITLSLSLSSPPPQPQPQQEPFVSRSSAGGSRNLLVPTPQHTPSLAGLAVAQQLSGPPPQHPVTAHHQLLLSPNPPLDSGQLQSGAKATNLSPLLRETFHSQLGWQAGGGWGWRMGTRGLGWVGGVQLSRSQARGPAGT